MKIGDVIESAIWLTGDESQEMRERYKRDVTEAIDYFCHENNFLHGPVTFIEKLPGTDRVPPVPDHVQGQRVRLLVAESTITAKAVVAPKGSFIANLDKHDLDRLRKITRRASMKVCMKILTDAECDEMIENLGPAAALDTLRYHVDGGMVH